MRLALLTAALLLATGCDTVGSSGSYAVTFLDTAGAEVSRATLAFDRPAAGRETTGTVRHVSGRQIASSEELLATGLEDGTVSVSLDVEVNDGGVGLVGPFSDGMSEGRWTVGTIVGPVPGGTFRAERQ